MEKNTLVKNLLTKKNKDYTYAVSFLLIFSFFIFFIIRPNLISVFEANAKIEELKKINNSYNEEIDKIIEVQSVLESKRDDLDYLNEAIASKPQVNKILSDVDVASAETNLISEQISVSDVNLKDKGALEKLKSFVVEMNVKGTFEDVVAYIKRVYAQRRLKLIPEFQVDRDEKESSSSSTLDIRFEVEGYYL